MSSQIRFTFFSLFVTLMGIVSLLSVLRQPHAAHAASAQQAVVTTATTPTAWPATGLVSASAPMTTPAPTLTPTPPVITLTDCIETIQNGSFEQNRDWNFTSAGYDTTTAHHGFRSGALTINAPNTITPLLWQRVIIPANSAALTLTFHAKSRTPSHPIPLTIRDAATRATLYDYWYAPFVSDVWYYFLYDEIASVRGRTIDLEFWLDPKGVVKDINLDSISLQACPPPASPTSTPTSTPVLTPTPTSTPTPTPTATPTLLSTPTTAPPTTTWTMLVYAVGDNDLSERIQEMINRLERAPAQANVRLVILYDGPQNGDSYRYLFNPSGANPIPEALAELKMDEQATLAHFLQWGLALPKTDRYYLAIVDHANGVVGIGQDQTSGDGYLTPSEVRGALREVYDSKKVKFDIVHYDGCSFGLFENAAIVEGLADYVIASPNTGWGIFDYPRYRLLANQHGRPLDLAQAIAAAYAEPLRTRYKYPYTISVFDMAHFSSMKEALSQLGNQLFDYAASNEDRLQQLRTSLQTYDSGGYTLEPADSYVDLQDLLAKLQLLTDPSAAPVIQAAQQLAATQQAFVAYESHQSGNLPATHGGHRIQLENAHGLGIYYPLQQGGETYSAYVGHAIFPALTRQSPTEEWGWVRFLKQGVPATGPGLPPPPLRLITPLGEEQRLFLPVVMR